MLHCKTLGSEPWEAESPPSGASKGKSAAWLSCCSDNLCPVHTLTVPWGSTPLIGVSPLHAPNAMLCHLFFWILDQQIHMASVSTTIALPSPPPAAGLSHGQCLLSPHSDHMKHMGSHCLGPLPERVTSYFPGSLTSTCVSCTSCLPELFHSEVSNSDVVLKATAPYISC